MKDFLKKLFKTKQRVLVFVILLVSTMSVLNTKHFVKKWDREKKKEYLDNVSSAIRSQLNQAILVDGHYPEIIRVKNRVFDVKYTFDKRLNDYIRKLLRQFKSDFSTVVVVDNNTGAILAASGFRRDLDQFDSHLVYSSTHPSASLFKIITSAELLEGAKVERDSLFYFNGKATTLYKYQLKELKHNRWTRQQTLERAFAISNNVVFGRAAIKNLSADDILKRAEKFGFNQRLMSELDLGPSKIELGEDSYGLAEVASGFNTTTLIGPIHGALLSSIVANDGILRFPSIIADIVDSTTGESLNLFHKAPERAIDSETALDLRKMMHQTVIKGTARSSFRRPSSALRDSVVIGGKTGSITGGVPFGRRDWFTAFAKPKDPADGLGISVCVMNINVKKWYVKSSYLTKQILEFYFNEIFSASEGLGQTNAKRKILKNDA